MQSPAQACDLVMCIHPPVMLTDPVVLPKLLDVVMVRLVGGNTATGVLVMALVMEERVRPRMAAIAGEQEGSKGRSA